MEKSWLSLSDIRFVIISRGRSDTIKSHKLFPYATLVCPESEVDLYKHTGCEIDPCPDNVCGLSVLRNWVINHFKEKVVVMIDDDVSNCWRVDNVHYKDITDVEEIRTLVCGAAQCAYDVDTFVFGFNQSWDVRHYKPCEPFSLSGWVGGVIGVIGKENSFIDNKLKVDVDFCLEALLHKRVIWRDNRISFVQIRDRNKGGNSKFRTKEVVETEKKKLKNKWGRYIAFKQTPSGENTYIKVKRRESYPNL